MWKGLSGKAGRFKRSASSGIWIPNYGDGSDGSPASSSFAVAKQSYQWVNYTLNNGHTITLSSDFKPSIFRCQGTLTINGTINGDGCGYGGGSSQSGYGASTNLAGYRGDGPGGGQGGYGGTPPDVAGGGGGGGHEINGINGGRQNYSGGIGGKPYDALGEVLRGSYASLVCGSGGGGGGVRTSSASSAGNPGGFGGGGLVVLARKIVLGATCSIVLRGLAGTASPWPDDNGQGAGGSGGGLYLVGEEIELPGAGTVITATGGNGATGGDGTRNGGNGAVGRVYAVYIRSISGDITARSNPAGVAINLATLPMVLG